MPALDREVSALCEMMQAAHVDAGMAEHVFGVVTQIERTHPGTHELVRKSMARQDIYRHIRKAGGKPHRGIVNALIDLALLRLQAEDARGI